MEPSSQAHHMILSSFNFGFGMSRFNLGVFDAVDSSHR
jgi:hypothetical protein